MKTISWFSTGASSFIATYLINDEIDEVIYTHIDNQHPDSLRYLKDCEVILNRKITILQSEFKTVESVLRYNSCIKFPQGAKCTDVLKRKVRIKWEYDQEDNLTYVWGIDCDEAHRAERIIEAMPDQNHRFPLIEKQLIKEDIHGMCYELGLKRPVMYDLGFNNNNCIGCVKGGMGYWNKIRTTFPNVFNNMAKLEREIGHTCLKNENGALFLDELDPDAGRGNVEITEDCGIMCQLALKEEV